MSCSVRFWLVSVVLTGCIYDSTRTELPRTELPRTEKGLELRLGDGPRPERAPVDRQGGDQPPKRDTRPKPDQLTRLEKGELLPDLPPINACAEGPQAVKQVYDMNSMIACGSSTVFDQCNAFKACNQLAGWDLCTATQFLARGGRNKPAAQSAWIAACARDNGKDNLSPADGLCTCTNAKATSFSLASWDCGNGADGATSNDKHLGVLASGGCFRIGSNSPMNEAFWTFYCAADLQNAVLCCK